MHTWYQEQLHSFTIHIAWDLNNTISHLGSIQGNNIFINFGWNAQIILVVTKTNMKHSNNMGYQELYAFNIFDEKTLRIWGVWYPFFLWYFEGVLPCHFPLEGYLGCEDAMERGFFVGQWHEGRSLLVTILGEDDIL